ncbi:MAG: Do family serine endopeptidase [Puniceicoccales bacterium]|nr:Do family serine endopeptidase [Puniceicoccales bacterium]
MKQHLSFILGLTALTLAITPAFSAGEKTDSKPKDPLVFQMEKTPVNRSNKEKFTSHADTLLKITPAVVSIRTAQVVRTMPRGRSLQEQILREFYGITPRENDTQPRERKMQTGLGSGTIIHADGYILTNRHVISDNKGEPAEEITVELADKREFTAKVIGSDPRTDIAIIKIEGKGKNLPVANLADSRELRVGDIVFAIGNPMDVGLTVTSGIVSALGRKVGILGEFGLESFIQTDASINPGNSGGPLVDAEGRVVGVNTAIASRTGGSVGIGFAVPSNLAVDIVNSLVNDGSVARGYFGVEGQDITPQLAENFNLPTPQGALINRIEDGSPAEKGGIKVEDTIVAINGEPVEGWASLRFFTSKLKPGEKAKVDIYRNGKKKTLTITAGSRPDEVKGGLFDEQEELETLNNDLRKQYNIPAYVRLGVVVTRISPGSVFSGELPEGTVILAVNGIAANSPEDIRKNIRKGAPNRLRVFAGGRIWSLIVTP